MYITDAEKTVLIAFLIALKRMEVDKLSNEVQKELREISKVVPLDINRLESLAEKDDYLNQFYEDAIDILVAGSSERKQGKKPKVNEPNESRSLENPNYSKESSDKRLLQETERIFTATNSNSIAVAKESIIVKMLEQELYKL